MRIANILFEYAAPGARLVDRTPTQLAKDILHELPPEHPVEQIDEVRASELDEGEVIWLYQLGDQELELELEAQDRQSPRRDLVVFLSQNPEHFVELGVVERAVELGLELVNVHLTERKGARFAAVCVPSADTTTSRSRIASELRLTRALLTWVDQRYDAARHGEANANAKVNDLQASLLSTTRERDDERVARSAAVRELQELRARVSSLQTDLQRLRREHAGSVKELARARGAEQKTTERLANAETERDDALRRAERVAAELERLHHRLQRTRESVTFRVGRATKLAIRASRKNPLKLPTAWMETFRGEDEILKELDPARLQHERSPSGVDVRSGVDIDAIEREHLLLGAPGNASTPMGPAIAGVVGDRLAEELRHSVAFTALTPNAWSHLLERDLPGFVLVTRDALDPGSAWGDYGTPAGRDGGQELAQLVAWCSARAIPVAYWDTLGAPASRLGLPKGVTVDAAFTVSPRLCGSVEGLPAVAHLAPGIEPRVHHPIGRARAAPAGVVYAGPFSHRYPARQRDALASLLRAAASSSRLDVLDPHFRYVGPGAAAVAFPEDLKPYTRRRPGVLQEARLVRNAGLAITAQCVSHADFPSWEALRGSALGARVLSTPTGFHDAALHLLTLSNPQGAGSAIDAALRDPLLSGAAARVPELVATNYDLRDRIATIASALNAPRTPGPRVGLGVIASPADAGEARALGEWVRAQRAPLREVLLVGEDVGVDEAQRATDLRVTRTPEPSTTHFVLWTSGLEAGGDLTERLAATARWSDAELVAVADSSDLAEVPLVYANHHQVTIAAVRASALRDLPGVPVEGIAAELLATGARQLVASGGQA